MIEIIIYILAGLSAGISSGLFGIGGGIIFVPALAAVFYNLNFYPEHIMHFSTGTSFAAMFLTTIAASIAHHKFGNMNKPLVKKIMPGSILGVVFGVFLASYLTTEGLRWCFAIFLMFVALSFLFGRRPKWANHNLPATPILFIFTLISGTCAGLLGIGGSILIVPFLTFFNVPYKKSVAAAVATALPLVLFGSISSMVSGYIEVGTTLLSVGYLYFPAVFFMGMAAFFGAPLGVYLNHKLPVPILKKLFGIILLIIAAKMLPLPV